MTQKEGYICINCQYYQELTSVYGTCEQAYAGAIDSIRMGSEEENVNVLVGCKFGCIHWAEVEFEDTLRF
jgi:hypothetical protein